MSLIVVDPVKQIIAADFRVTEGGHRASDLHKLRAFDELEVIIGGVGGLRDMTVASQWCADTVRNDSEGEELAWALADHLVEHGTSDKDSTSHIILVDKKVGSVWFIEDTRAVLPIKVPEAYGHGAVAANALLDAGHGLDDVFKYVARRDNTVSAEYEALSW